MENSACSYTNLGLPNSNGDQVDHDLCEESGWTQYLVDFQVYCCRKQKEGDEEEETSNCSNFISASLVSDAGSGPEWRNRHSTATMCISMPRELKLINKGINREKDVAFDESLEDTASSPVNSPKIVSSFKRIEINSRKIVSNFDTANYLGRGAGCQEDRKKNEQGHEMEVDEFSELLEKKGLCLVPVSMLTNHIA